MQTILITGINGFLGSWLARTMHSQYRIIGLEYETNNLSAIAELNFRVYPAKNGVPDEVFDNQQIDIIIHTATFYGREGEDAAQLFQNNLAMPFTLLQKAIRYGSSIFINTDTVLDRFTNAYALSKRHLQEWLLLSRNQIKVVNIQLEHFFGPGASRSNFITAMLTRLLQNENHIDLTAGKQQRNFVYIEDVVVAYKAILENSFSFQNYEHFEIAGNETVSIKELMILMKEMTGSSTHLNFGAIPYREKELMKPVADNSKISKMGWEPKISLSNGLKKTIESLTI